MFGLFAKRAHRVVINGRPALTLTRNETILNGALRGGLQIPHSCKVGGCGSCKCRLLEGRVREFTDKSYLLSKEDIAANMILACQSAPRSDVAVEFPGWSGDIRAIDGRITAVDPLTRDIAEIRIRLEQPLHYRAGQSARLKASGTDIPERSYSFAHRCDAAGTRDVAFIVRAVEQGRMSNWLLDARAPGRRIRLTGPQGDFHLRDASRPVIAVAGGSGLAPINALLEAAIADNAAILDQPMTLLLGMRTQRDLYYGNALAHLAGQWRAAFGIVPVLSSEPEDSDWRGARGFVSDAIRTADCAAASAYLCGPPAMVDAAMKVMLDAGMPPQRIHFDRFADQSRANR